MRREVDPIPPGDPDPTPGQVMGFAGLLKAWRAAAGARRGRTITQQEAAAAIKRSVRSYGAIERGATVLKLDGDQCEALAELLMLSRDERRALMLHSLGTLPEAAPRRPDPRVKKALQLFIDQQMPSPAYLSDGTWSILAYNHTMAEWWPWVTEPDANLMKWALLSPEARVQYSDWEKHAEVYVRLLKFAVASRRGDKALLRLISDVCADPDVGRIWKTHYDLGADRDGHVFHMDVPALGETVEVVSHVLFPASLPECRLVVITWVQGDESNSRRIDALGGVRDAWADRSSGVRHLTREWKRPAELPRRSASCRTPDEAAAFAGDGGVRLPALSRHVGPDVRLTLSPSNASVIWATRKSGSWAVAEFNASAVLARFPCTGDPDTTTELDALMRTTMACSQQQGDLRRPRATSSRRTRSTRAGVCAPNAAGLV
ncbi:MmyB family transcriptional regulator [Streptomyces sp. NBC_00503]|uniref:MmyB family transcriptional regulator n=1 Tax=Streptomyces sp. NBC_00503 TaxID=2903659 RepID=UPI002E819B84|nr:XRE family transcriptional regulator [Streptomyces sp. NBC_00503]WUD85654.1 XRE family transcriptional regulator [Streptomyces sp. NBC_00503]